MGLNIKRNNQLKKYSKEVIINIMSTNKKKQQRVILTVGASGSGKTTWTNNFILSQKDKNNWIDINRDKLRDLYSHPNKYKFSKVNENTITTIQRELIKESLKLGKSIIISDTNLNKNHRINLLAFLSELGYKGKVEFEYFYLPIQTLLDNNLNRTDSRPLEVIYRMSKQMREEMGKPIYKANKELPKAIIFDIDGTLAHNKGHRGPFEYDKSIDDEVDGFLVEQLRFNYYTGINIIILTGRESDKDSNKSSVTVEWLNKHGIPFDEIYCRAHKDHRNDAIVKEELFFDNIADRFNVQCVFDDREQVVNMWRDIDVTCYQVAKNLF